MEFVDVSHTIDESISTFGTLPAPKISPFLTHEGSKKNYENKASFTITHMDFQTTCGTYIDSPYHRYPDMYDISEIKLESTILPGKVIDVSYKLENEPILVEDIQDSDYNGKAVLFHTGWDKYWKKEEYHEYPFLSKEGAEYLIEKGVLLAGIDTVNIDTYKDVERPAHTLLLRKGILIVENLCNLNLLLGKDFTFFSCPLKVKGAAAFPVRAFAILDE